MDNFLQPNQRIYSFESDVSLRLLPSPNSFYQQLREELKVTKNAITFSALYLGTGEHEKELLHDIRKALQDLSRPNLQITMIFDHSRAQRGPDSSLDLLLPLVKDFGDRFRVLLYQLPQLRGLLSFILPLQIREVIGVYHCKFCISDSSAIVTGANLSKEYFSTRQDRYWLIKRDSKVSGESNLIADYLNDFVIAVTPACHRFTSHGLIQGPEDPSHLRLKQFHLRTSLKLEEEDRVPSSSEALHFLPLIQHNNISIHDEENFFLHLLKRVTVMSEKDASLLPSLHWSTPYTNFSSSLLEGLVNVFVQANAHNHRRDATDKDKDNEKNKDTLHAAHCIDVIGPDDSSHGFASATGLKSFIPRLHETAFSMSIEQALKHMQYKSVQDSFTSNTGSNWFTDTNKGDVNGSFMTHYAFSKPDWTFHAKGFWLSYPKTSSNSHSSSSSMHDSEKTSERLPLGTYIGSSNFGERSWQRDFELGFFFYSSSPRYRQYFAEDYTLLKKQCSAKLPNIALRTGTGAGPKNNNGFLTMLDQTFFRFVTWFAKSYL